jgi:hypothetical protein
MGQIFRWIWPFWFAMAMMLILLVFFHPTCTFPAANNCRWLKNENAQVLTHHSFVAQNLKPAAVAVPGRIYPTVSVWGRWEQYRERQDIWSKPGDARG